MTLSFDCYCETQWGETLYVIGGVSQLGNWNPDKALAMNCIAPNKWKLVLNISAKSKPAFEYKYLIKSGQHAYQIWEPGKNRTIKTRGLKYKHYHIQEQWASLSPEMTAWESSAFTGVIFKPDEATQKQLVLPIKTTRVLEFSVTAPQVHKNQWLGISGSCDALGNWDIQKAIPLNNGAFPDWKLALDMTKLPNTFDYKYLIFDKEDPQNVIWEEGFNRSITLPNLVDDYSVYKARDNQFRYANRQIKGAGVSLPVFSIRTSQSFGVGDFSDLKKVIDWAQKTKLHMIQILPVNDTQSTHTFLDSYPYKAISVFALHPLYLNIFKMGKLKETKLFEEFKKFQKNLNEKESVEYENIVKLKLKYSRLLFAEKKNSFLKNKDYKAFFTANKNWLVPYAVFSYLRDKFGTGDFTTWGSYSTYNLAQVKHLLNESSPEFDQIALWYFVQYHLHKQLKDASTYGRERGIVLKGDIPIGISRYSVDAWYEPRLYHFDGQAGAPPDDFSADGQNWGFPTYNWHEMAKDNYQWWRNRLTKMAEYFDAYRIDHILGFFRIWEIPYDAIQGILGHFRPALPFSHQELQNQGIWFDYNRMCKPYIRGHFLYQLFHVYTEEVIQDYLIETSFSVFELKPEFGTQRAIYEHFVKKGGPEDLPEKEATLMWGLIRLAAEVLLLPDGDNYEQFHPRISLHSTFSYQELDNETKERFNAIYIHYFYHRHEQFWKKQALEKLPALVNATNMLICGEDLGMIPASVPEVMNQFGILSLEIQRMPKDPKKNFAHPADAPYLSVCTTSTHDMATIRGWWEENREKTQLFYNQQLGKWGEMPYFAEPWVCKEILIQHLYSPAMWTVFPIQDLLAMDEKLRIDNPNQERINEPANPRHYWKYRMHLTMEELLKAKTFNKQLAQLIQESGRKINN
ncbi:MAG: 4-alpha-glucanotransferase [Bacteroidetes bacterium HGW-Bacteroidetes-4]|jgi:4-alpha-glucanotransferase|nr:MAG: 4-alpha-glucanotransferase [Bacteroidetes bacterium HGW-Bacteroidetes-4]